MTRTISYGYDAFNRPTTTTDAHNKTITTVYDDAGNVAAEISASSDKITYGYDLAGRQTSMVTPRGNLAGADPTMFTTSYLRRGRQPEDDDRPPREDDHLRP